jgi:hypothetical protein
MACIPSAASEYEGADLGDRRLSRRLEAIGERLAAAPSASFPKIVPSIAEREAFYRFVGNERVAWQEILRPHHEATAARCREAKVVRVAHDTTWFGFEGVRTGLGPIGSSRHRKAARGFAGHVSLATTATGGTAALGVLNVVTFVRKDAPVANSKELRKARHRASREKPRSAKESVRWMDGVRSTAERVGPGVRCIHVMDREGDSFAILADLVDGGHRFVVRGSLDRRLAPRDAGVHVREALDELSAEVFREVPLSPRPNPKKSRMRRGERTARLMIRARVVTLAKPDWAQHSSSRLALHVVHVFEPKPPKGEEPVEWALYTTEPIATAEDLEAVVDHYRARWTIEEFFKSLKTGCAYERRQLESYDSLLRGLALLVPVAWHLLALRGVARSAGNEPAAMLVDDVQLDVLRTLTPRSRIPLQPSTKDVMRAIADLGGHIPQNGEPGWLVLGRGYEEFARAEAVWRAAIAHATM